MRQPTLDYNMAHQPFAINACTFFETEPTFPSKSLSASETHVCFVSVSHDALIFNFYETLSPLRCNPHSDEGLLSSVLVSIVFLNLSYVAQYKNK